MDSSKKKAMNLTVIKRMDGHVIDILDSSSHVVVYDFEPETESWVTFLFPACKNKSHSNSTIEKEGD